MQRRHLLAAAAAAPLLACQPVAAIAHIEGGFTGINFQRGHVLQGLPQFPEPSVTHRTRVVIAGGGVAGLAAARALRLKGMNDFVLLELEDEAGGNSRGGVVNGIACPLGAHYLPLPSDDAPEVQNLLEELGLRQRVAGRWQYDERHLCHSPQERVYFKGGWQPGLLPVQGVGAATLAQYKKFASIVTLARAAARWTIPASNSPSIGTIAPVFAQLFAITFEAFLDFNGLTDLHLRWYLDYCCRDDYGAGIATVSAWAGIHYFASRHGFTAPHFASATGEPDATEADEAHAREGLLTWPEGNAWLTRRLAAPLKERLQTGWVVVRVATQKHGVQVDAYNPVLRVTHRWEAQHCINALPVFVAARVVQNPPDFLTATAAHTRYAPWLVANIHIDKPLQDHPGAAPAWDNVLYPDSPAQAHANALTGGGLGYVDAGHQNLHPVPGATVLTHYRALGDVPAGRQRLMQTPWTTWRDTILAEMAQAHPDIAAKTTRIDITRYGHAMAMPIPKVEGQKARLPPYLLNSLLSKKDLTSLASEPILYAHSDWAGYSVFEEAFTLGHSAGRVLTGA
jgi:hypothetical protein